MDPACPKTIKKQLKNNRKTIKNRLGGISRPAGRPARPGPAPAPPEPVFYCFSIVFLLFLDCFGARWVHFDCFLIVFPIVVPIVFQKINYFQELQS